MNASFSFHQPVFEIPWLSLYGLQFSASCHHLQLLHTAFSTRFKTELPSNAIFTMDVCRKIRYFFIHSFKKNNETMSCKKVSVCTAMTAADDRREAVSENILVEKNNTQKKKQPSMSVSYLSSSLREATLRHHQGQQSSSPHSSYSHSCHVENVTGALYHSRARTHTHAHTPFTETLSSHW